MIGAIGLIIGIALLIVLTLKGVNAVIASLVASIAVIITNGLPFWNTFVNEYSSGFGSFMTSCVSMIAMFGVSA